MSPGISMHRRAWDLIPWIVNGTVDAQERAAVESHVSGCELCRGELQFQRELYDAISDHTGTAAESDEAVEAGWQGLRARLQHDGPAGLEEPLPTEAIDGAATRRIHSARRHWGVAWAAVATFEALALGALGMALWSKAPSPSAAGSSAYRTLSAAPTVSAPASIRIVLEPSTTIAQLQALLDHSGLRVVDGPSAEGVWSLAASSAAGQAAMDAALKSLRADPRVRFAEPLGIAR